MNSEGPPDGVRGAGIPLGDSDVKWILARVSHPVVAPIAHDALVIAPRVRHDVLCLGGGRSVISAGRPLAGSQHIPSWVTPQPS